MNVLVPYDAGNSFMPEKLLDFQEELSSMELVLFTHTF
jgi:hypothetical protein